MNLQVIASGSKGNCYVLDDGNRQLMIECGVSINAIKAALDFDFSRVDGCLVTHSHQDHCKAASDLCKLGVNIYSSSGTLHEIGLDNHHRAIALNPEVSRIGAFKSPWRTLPFAIKHDTSEPFGFFITNNANREKFIFLTDAAYSPFAFTEIDYLLVECNHDYDSLNDSVETDAISDAHRLRVMTNHFSLENCVEFAKVCAKYSPALRRVVLLHTSDQNADVNKMIKTMQEKTGIVTEVAIGGKTIEL